MIIKSKHHVKQLVVNAHACSAHACTAHPCSLFHTCAHKQAKHKQSINKAKHRLYNKVGSHKWSRCFIPQMEQVVNAMEQLVINHLLHLWLPILLPCATCCSTAALHQAVINTVFSDRRTCARARSCTSLVSPKLHVLHPTKGPS